MSIEQISDWFSHAIDDHQQVTSVTCTPDGLVQLTREHQSAVIVAPVSVDRLEVHHLDRIFAASMPTIVCVVPTMSHYTWEARQYALDRGSSVQTMAEVYGSLYDDDPREFLDSSVRTTRDLLVQHSKVRAVYMICEASIEITRKDNLRDLTISVEKEYEFGEEAMVNALSRHPDVDTVVNARVAGKLTRAAIEHARNAEVGLFGVRDFMRSLRYD